MIQETHARLSKLSTSVCLALYDMHTSQKSPRLAKIEREILQKQLHRLRELERLHVQILRDIEWK